MTDANKIDTEIIGEIPGVDGPRRVLARDAERSWYLAEEQPGGVWKALSTRVDLDRASRAALAVLRGDSRALTHPQTMLILAVTVGAFRALLDDLLPDPPKHEPGGKRAPAGKPSDQDAPAGAPPSQPEPITP